ncbi:MAG: DegV family EDD domain-containing protein [Erysipelotrichaceae bacterium]|nr:DegV family EDD domain-containing protein [Erysipelotrichaceae bacterium]
MTIKSTQVYNAFVSGAQSLINQKRILNEINVFPVADGDTGSNMASTMQGLLRQSRQSDSMSETMNSIAEAVSMNAKGNSGAIMAQFIIGFSENVPDHDLSDNDFIDGLKVAVKKVYGALSHPVEGTMITVMRLWVEEVETLYKNSHDFKKAINASLNKAYAVLKDTPNLLLVLKEHHVVDSGAKGFVHFIEGFIKGLYTTEKIKIEESIEDLDSEIHIHQGDEIINYRYCTEALVYTSTDASNELRNTLEALGDSLLMVKSRNYLKIHLHTNTPYKLMEALRPLGPIIQQKAEDMILQHKDLQPKTKIALLTDSIADLPQSFIDEAQVHVYPLTIMIDEAPYLDRLTMTSSIFYDQLSQFKKYPSSSQPNLKSIQDIYSSLLEHYSQVLVVSVSSKMSGTHQVFEKAAEGLEGKVMVVDSKQNSGAQGLLVTLAHQLILEGHSIEVIKTKLEEASRNTKIFVSVDTLKYMVKMGRIPPVLGKIGKWTNMKPIVTIDSEGHGKTMGSAFSKKQTEKRMINEVIKMTSEKKLINYCIVHGNDLERAQRFSELLTQKLNKAPLYIEEVSSIVAMSAGPKTFAIALHVEELT